MSFGHLLENVLEACDVHLNIKRTVTATLCPLWLQHRDSTSIGTSEGGPTSFKIQNLTATTWFSVCYRPIVSERLRFRGTKMNVFRHNIMLKQINSINLLCWTALRRPNTLELLEVFRHWRLTFPTFVVGAESPSRSKNKIPNLSVAL